MARHLDGPIAKGIRDGLDRTGRNSFSVGANWVEKGSAWNFALHSKDAEGVTLLLYAEADLVNPIFTYRFDYLRNKSGRIWHCRIAEAVVRGARYYAYSVEGLRAQGGSAWHCFDS